MSKSLYEAIGVSPTASQEEIEAACIRLGQEYDPAGKPGNLQAAMLFKEVEHAYEVLGQPEKRKQYDEECRASPAPKQKIAQTPARPELKPLFGSENWSAGQKVGGILAIFLVIAGVGSNIQESQSKKVAVQRVADDARAQENAIADKCFTAGQSLAMASVANIRTLSEANVMPSEIMEQGCDKEAGISQDSKVCRRNCLLGFKSKAREILK